MTQANKLPEIRKEAFKKARESAGLSTQELALKACLSNRQIEQLENGEIASFYGAQVKYTAAKKVAALLKLAEQDAFDFGSQSTVIEKAVLVEETPPVETKKIKTNTAEATKEVVTKVEQPIAKSPAIQSKPDVALELQDVDVEKAVARQRNSSSSQRKWMLILSAIAAVIFSVVNLRPLFFPEAPKEVVAEVPVVPVDPVPPNPAPALEEKTSAAVPLTPPVASAAVSSTECPAMDSAPTTYKPDAPKKAADMVYTEKLFFQYFNVMEGNGR